jgi:predicted AAA+ superfamily ATPase
MQTFNRKLDLASILQKKSHFLFGPRAVGKSHLIRTQLSEKAQIFNLLDNQLFFRLSQAPHQLASMIKNIDKKPWVVIDEVQLIPALLNEVLIEEKGITFLLTGSSARKLKRGQANLLAGRARESRLFPLTYQEIGNIFSLERYLQYGGLPAIVANDDPIEDLYAYINIYLREEIQAEAIVRNIPAFSRFLELSALTSGSILNFSKISSDVGLTIPTIREYYHVLEDTFLGFVVPPYQKTRKRKPIQTAKFYFFDVGVKNALAKIKSLPPQSELYGDAFEHFIAMELKAYLSYRREHHLELFFWQEKNGKEVDFIVGDQLAIEVKATNNVQDKHLKGLACFMEEKCCERYIVVSQDTIPRQINGIETMHWTVFLELLWQDAFF